MLSVHKCNLRHLTWPPSPVGDAPAKDPASYTRVWHGNGAVRRAPQWWLGMAYLGRLQESDCFPREKLSQILESSYASAPGCKWIVSLPFGRWRPLKG